MIIDCHTHLGGFGGEAKFPIAPPEAKDLISAMDESGVDLSFIISNYLTGFEKGRKPEELLEEIKEYPSRLKAIIHLDFPRLAEKGYLESLIEMLDNPSVVGFKFFLGYQNCELLDPRLSPLFEKLQELKMPVVIHTGYLLVGVSAFEEAAHPFEIKGILAKYPSINFVAAHFGNPWVKECAKILSEYPNLFVDLSGYFTEFQPLSREEKEEFKEDVSSLLSNFLSKEVDSTRLLFGTDWPLYSQKEYVEVVKDLDFSEKDLENIFSENALRIFRVGF